MKFVLLTYQASIERETDRAILIDRNWLPRSQITIENGDDGKRIITMPYWLARKVHGTGTDDIIRNGYGYLIEETRGR